MEAKNELSNKLLAEGYTPENPPPYAQWHSGWREFEYTLDAVKQMVWGTPCGLLRQGVIQDGCGWGSFGGVVYRPENNNLRIGCPYYDELPCSHRDPATPAGWNCTTQRTDRPYDYKESVEKIWDEWDKIESAARKEAMQGYGYCSCMKWDRPKRKYLGRYDVLTCIYRRCENEVCAITRRARDLKKVNIYYDILREKHYKKGLFEFTEREIEKGVKRFDSAVARTDAEIFLKIYKDKFEPRYTRDDRRELHFSQYHGKGGYGEYDWCEYSVTPQNIRIEHRESRDLLQDLRDIAEGIAVVHASDLKKKAAQAKRDRRTARQEAKARKNEKQSIETYKMWLFEGVTKDGEPASEALKIHARRELEKRGIDLEEKEQEQLALFGQ